VRGFATKIAQSRLLMILLSFYRARLTAKELAMYVAAPQSRMNMLELDIKMCKKKIRNTR